MAKKFGKIETSERCRLLRQMSDSEFDKMVRGMTTKEILDDPCLQMMTNKRIPDKIIVRRAPFPRGEVPAPLRPFTEGLSELMVGVKGVVYDKGKTIPATAKKLGDITKKRAKRLISRPWER